MDNNTEKLLAMIEETTKSYDKTLGKLASGEPDGTRPENTDNKTGKDKKT